MSFTLIKDLDREKKCWKIIVRVFQISEIHYDEKRSCAFSFYVLDESGEIKINVYNEEARKYYTTLKINEVYEISNGSIVQSYAKYSIVNNENEIKLIKASIIEKVVNDKIPKLTIQQKPINQVAELNYGVIVDVVGVVLNIDKVEEYKLKSEGDKTTYKRSITLVDESGIKVLCVLWGNQATSFKDEYLEKILYIKGCIITTWNHKSLRVQKDAIIRLVKYDKLQNWFLSQSQEALNSMPSISDLIMAMKSKKFNISQVKQLKFDKSTIVYARVDGKILSHSLIEYNCCTNKNCKQSKINIDEKGVGYCPKCKSEIATPGISYKIDICISDDNNSELWFVAFGSIAKDLEQRIDNNNPDKIYGFQLKCFNEQYKNQLRTKFVCVKILDDEEFSDTDDSSENDDQPNIDALNITDNFTNITDMNATEGKLNEEINYKIKNIKMEKDKAKEEFELPLELKSSKNENKAEALESKPKRQYTARTRVVDKLKSIPSSDAIEDKSGVRNKKLDDLYFDESEVNKPSNKMKSSLSSNTINNVSNPKKIAKKK